MRATDLTRRLQTAWNGIEVAERALGEASAALATDPAQAAAIADAVLAYQRALVEFRNVQLDAFTVLFGQVELMQLELAELRERSVS